MVDRAPTSMRPGTAALRLARAALVSMLVLVSVLTTASTLAADAGSPSPCPVTQPNGLQPPPEGNAFAAGYGDYGNAWLWTSLWIWGEGAVDVPADHRSAAGEAVDLKWSWYRFVPGQLTITGRRLDASAPPLRATVPEGYGDQGFQVSGLTFPTPGCWEVTGHIGDAGLTFVVLVEHLASGTPPAILAHSDVILGCPVTQPNGVHPPGERPGAGDYGNGALWTTLAMWSAQPGIVLVPDDGRIDPDGTIDNMKWAWYRMQPGALTITGWRLDDPGFPPLRAEVPAGYGDTGFQVSGLTFPSAGCWEIVGSLGNAQLAFIVDVIAPGSPAATPVSG